MSDDISMLVVELKRDAVVDTVKRKLANGENPISVLDECRKGMTIVGERFQAGDYYLAELMLSAEVFKSAVAILDPYLARTDSTTTKGRVVLATLKGDIHDLGKNILATLLKAHGFEVYDLGVDVLPEKLVASVQEIKPQFVGFSALITAAFESMKVTADLLNDAGLRDGVKLMVGGGVTTPMVKDHIGADFQTVDATEGVEYCVKIVGGE